MKYHEGNRSAGLPSCALRDLSGKGFANWRKLQSLCPHSQQIRISLFRETTIKQRV